MAILAINDSKMDDIDKDLKVLSIIYGKSVDVFERISFKNIEKLIKQSKSQLEAIQSVKPRKYLFTRIGILKALTDVRDEHNCFAQYKDVKFLNENGGVEKNLNKLLACVYRPLGWNLKPKEYSAKNFNRVSKYILDCDVRKCLGVVFFYSRAYERLIQLTEIYTEEQLDLIAKVRNEALNYQGSLINGVGTI